TLGHTYLQSLDISKNLEIESLDITSSLISTIDISNHSKIRYLAMSGSDLISSAELDKVIADLLSHSASANPPGHNRYFEYGLNKPSATGLANLEILKNQHDWHVNYIDSPW